MTDTAAKRASAAALLSWPVHAPPLPDGAITAPDWLHAAHVYAGIAAAAPAGVSLADLMGYWPLDEASGIRYDVHSTNHLAVEGGAPSGAAGKIGTSTVFTVSDGLRYTGSALDLTATDSYTISVWVYPTSVSAYHVIVNQLGSTSRKIYLLTIPGGELGMWDHSYSGFNLALNTWQHVVYTYTSGGTNTGTETYYVNGVQRGTPRTGAMPAPDTGGLRVGWDDPAYTNNWRGALDELGIWRRVLTTDEITTLYGGGAGLAYPFGPVAPTATQAPRSRHQYALRRV